MGKPAAFSMSSHPGMRKSDFNKEEHYAKGKNCPEPGRNHRTAGTIRSREEAYVVGRQAEAQLARYRMPLPGQGRYQTLPTAVVVEESFTQGLPANSGGEHHDMVGDQRLG